MIYLNTASCGLVSPSATAAAIEMYTAFETNSSSRSESWRMNEEDRIRETIASFLQVSAKNVAMVPNFSWAMNGIVQSLRGTERVLLYKHDYPSLLEPFRINGFDITWIDAPDGFAMQTDVLKDCISNRKVDIVAISHVQWTSGYKLDIEAIAALCRQHDVLLIVDATQSMGAMPIYPETWGVDVFICSNYKWMNAGFGTGIMYMSDNFINRYTPVVGGHNSYKMVDDSWMYTPSVQSFEPGHPNMFGLMVLEAAIRHKMTMGLQEIAKHNEQLTKLFLDNLKGLPVSILGDYTTTNRASIVIMKDEDGLGDWIKQHGITITQRNGLLRVGIHYYNTGAEVMALADCIKAKFAVNAG